MYTVYHSGSILPIPVGIFTAQRSFPAALVEKYQKQFWHDVPPPSNSHLSVDLVVVARDTAARGSPGCGALDDAALHRSLGPLPVRLAAGKRDAIIIWHGPGTPHPWIRDTSLSLLDDTLKRQKSVERQSTIEKKCHRDVKYGGGGGSSAINIGEKGNRKVGRQVPDVLRFPVV
jgi:hypothetical protein